MKEIIIMKNYELFFKNNYIIFVIYILYFIYLHYLLI